MNTRMSKEDICAYLGEDFYSYKGAVTPPIFQNTLFAQSHELKGEEPEFVYTRINNPTIEIAEKKIAALEEGQEARCFSSGMGAISAAIMHFVKAGSHVVAVDSIYGPTRDFLEIYLARFGVETTFVPGHNTDEIESAIKKNTVLIYLESPSSLVFSLQDLEAVAKLARAKGIVTIIDNSYSTPIYQNPIKFGIDLVVHSATKYLGGHSDIVAGVVIGKKDVMDGLRNEERAMLGSCMDPHQAWLLIRGLRTLPLRVKQHQENAMAVAAFLENHPRVKYVLYPGLKSHPQYDLGKKQMEGYTGLMSFELTGGKESVGGLLKNIRHFRHGCSWGGYESLIAPVGLGKNQEELKRSCVTGGMIRIHVGLENVNTLIEDLDRCLV